MHDEGTTASTVATSIQYVNACRAADLLCHARIVRRARELTFCEMTAAAPGGTVTAHRMLAYRIV